MPQAFLQSPLQVFDNVERIFVKFPYDISPLDEHGKQVVYLVTGSIYGMKQSPWNFEKLLSTFLKTLGFTQSAADTTLYYQPGIMILVWVDDISIRATQQCAHEFKQAMNKKFGDCKFGPLEHCIGLTIIRNPVNKCVGFH